MEEVPDAAPLVGIGISVPGLVRNSDGLIRLAPNLEWHDVSFGGIVLAALGLDVPVSIAQRRRPRRARRARPRRRRRAWTTSSTSRATSVSVPASSPAGVRLEGAGGYAGEVGHLRFNPAGRECHCGNRGCWETEVGAHAIAEAIHCPADKVAQLDEVLDGFGEPSPALRATGTALGHGLASIVNVFNPRQVGAGRLLPLPLRARAAPRSRPGSPTARCRLRSSR